jgi:transcriptional regulator with XRE-family HTH domain
MSIQKYRNLSIRVHFGNNARELRERKGMGQAELCDRTGWGQAYLSRVENGRVNISLESMQLLAKALGTSIAELVKGL